MTRSTVNSTITSNGFLNSNCCNFAHPFISLSQLLCSRAPDYLQGCHISYPFHPPIHIKLSKQTIAFWCTNLSHVVFSSVIVKRSLLCWCLHFVLIISKFITHKKEMNRRLLRERWRSIPRGCVDLQLGLSMWWASPRWAPCNYKSPQPSDPLHAKWERASRASNGNSG